MPVLCLDSHELKNACQSAHLCTQCTYNGHGMYIEMPQGQQVFSM